MEFRILGPVEAWHQQDEISLDGSKQRTVLAALLLADGHVLSTARLSELLWGGNPPETLNAQIHTYVSRLRKYLGPQVSLVRKRPGYLLKTHGAHFDYQEFERLAQRGSNDWAMGNHDLAARDLRAALALWKGPALVNTTEHLIDTEGVQLEEARTAALEHLFEAELALGRHYQLVSELTSVVQQHPLRERLRAQLMVALYRCDRQADALAVYEEGRRTLGHELGIIPGTTLRQAHQAVLTGAARWELPPTGPEDAEITVWQHVRPAMLPAAIPDFTGREEQLDQLRDLLRPADRKPATVCLVSGMAGVGKTAFAVRAAHEVRSEFPDGQLYADLGADSRRPADPADILMWFLCALGVSSHAVPETLEERMQLYRSHTGDKRILVVLDNAAAGRQVRPLLPGGPQCRVIITSRACPLTPEVGCLIDLDLLAAGEAAELFGRVAGAGRAAAEPGAVQRIVELCGRLPLAVRIAAARLVAKPHWPVSHLANRLADGRHRLGELRLGEMDVRASLRISYARLAGAARTAFHALGAAGLAEFTAVTAAPVLHTSTDTADDILESLVDDRLLSVAGVDHGGFLRYRYHPLVLDFARELAAEQVSTQVGQPLTVAGSTHP